MYNRNYCSVILHSLVLGNWVLSFIIIIVIFNGVLACVGIVYLLSNFASFLLFDHMDMLINRRETSLFYWYTFSPISLCKKKKPIIITRITWPLFQGFCIISINKVITDIGNVIDSGLRLTVCDGYHVKQVTYGNNFQPGTVVLYMSIYLLINCT